MKPEIYFRVDASHSIGYGHLTRCISICNGIQDFHSVFFSIEDLSDTLNKETSSSVTFHQLKQSDDFFNHVGENSIVILDGYQFTHNYHLKIRNTGALLVVIDDNPDKLISPDIYINPSPGISINNGKNPLEMVSLTGLDYVLLRQPFLDITQCSDVQKQNDTLFICFGGSDPLNKTKQVVKTILDHSIQFKHISIVTGAGYLYLEDLKSTIESTDNISLHSTLNADEMALLMKSTEFAIIPSSGVLVEALAARMKVLSGYYIENQKLNYENHLIINSFIDVKNFSSVDLIAALNDRKKINSPEKLIDGKSIQRIEKNIRLLLKSKKLTLRKASDNDTKETHEWANSPSTRKFSFKQEPIPLVDHTNWFSTKISSPNCFYQILENQDSCLGSIRFDIQDGIATISYLVAPDHYRQGYGTILMILGLKALSKNYTSEQIKTVQGFVLLNNIASLKTFKRIGFHEKLEADTYLFSKKFVPHD